jgi:hypothetical protein
MNREKPKLFRKVNTKAIRVFHDFGGDFKNTRKSKKETPEQSKGKMFGKKQRGLDYTPLYKFLLSKVGGNWDEIYSEAKSRLDKVDPIFIMVAIKEEDKKDFVCVGGSSFFSGLYVDEEKVLQITNPNLTASDMEPYCTCCTHTFNGIVFPSTHSVQ